MSVTDPILRVPHLRDGFIVAKVGIARQRDRSSLPRQCNTSKANASRYPNVLALASRYPKASALGLISTPTRRGFSPWGLPSFAEAR